MSKTEKSRSPFAHPWRWEQFRTTATGEFQVARVLEPEHRVIRRVPLYLLDADHRRQVDHAVAAFTAFGRYPGLYVPRFHIIRAELEPGDDRPNFRPYVFIVDRVDDETLSAKTFRRRERQEAQQYLSAFLHALTLFVGATWRRGSWYPADQTPMQYVYGSDAMGRR